MARSALWDIQLATCHFQCLAVSISSVSVEYSLLVAATAERLLSMREQILKISHQEQNPG